MPSLLQQIADLESTAPDYDPEDSYNAVPDESALNDETAHDSRAAAREHYLDVGTSTLRTQLHESVSDPKYEGVRTSRNRIFDDDESEASHEHSGDDSQEDSQEEDDAQEAEQDELSDESEEEDTPSTRKVTFADDTQPPPIEQKDLTSSLKENRNADRLKGKAITRQLSLWDTLVNARIQMQKGVVASNRLPRPDRIPDFFAASPEAVSAANRMLAEAMTLSDTIFDLQETLLSNQGVDLPPRKKRRADDGSSIPLASRDFETELATVSSTSASLESTAHPHAIQTLSKWSSKIHAVSPSALLPSKKTSFRQQSAVVPKSAVELVSEVLSEGRAKAVGRTRVRRGVITPRVGDVISSEKENDNEGGMELDEGLFKGKGDERERAQDVPEEGDAEIFDDTDFYQEMLRDVIDSKSGKEGMLADAGDLSRPKKIKKKVDTKASKGRKLRYEVHEKIQNFMVPIANVGPNAWHEEQIDELFASLLGKGFQNSSGGVMDVDDESGSNAVGNDGALGGEVSLQGLRVF